MAGKYNEQVVTNLVTTDAPFVARPAQQAQSQPLAARQDIDMSSCLSKFVGRQSAGTATRAMPAREPAFIRKILRAPRHERDAVHTHTRLHDGPTQTMRLHTAADANLSKQDEEQRSWRRVETYTTMSHQHAAWSCPAWRRAAGRAETCAVDRCEERRPPGDPDSLARFRPYLAHFFPVFSRFLRVFTVSTRRFQRAPSRNPGPRDSGKGAQTPFCRP